MFCAVLVHARFRDGDISTTAEGHRVLISRRIRDEPVGLVSLEDVVAEAVVGAWNRIGTGLNER